MIERDLLIAGMFRSGTTLLSSLLSDHPGGLVVSDPFVYFFKHYRNLHLDRLGVEGWHPDEPTPDYFGGERRGLLDSLLDADLSESIGAATLEQLRTDIRTWKGEQQPDLCARLDEVEGTTFADTYRALIELAIEVHAEGPISVGGTKVSWCEEFLPALARAFPDMRFVMPVRDLRAVVASQNSQRGVGEGKRPLLFYVRHWRKSVSLAHHFVQRHPLLAGRVELVRYEDLVAAPESTLERLCAHVGLAPASLHASDQDLAGFAHNSSFEPASPGIFTDSTDRWRSVLDQAEVEAIEAMAGPELALMGYSLTTERRRPTECLDTDCEPAFEDLSGWLQGHTCAAYLRDPALRRANYEAEERRRSVLESGVDPGADTERDLFLVEGLLPALREAWL